MNKQEIREYRNRKLHKGENGRVILLDMDTTYDMETSLPLF